ncbi:putative adhesin [Streptomyces sp. NPDC056519]|uniref:putative adhesin n=1 Tax=Streptomyces sp. NPDC056519 TaxID=3345849 RepID=UPI0036C3FDE0
MILLPLFTVPAVLQTPEWHGFFSPDTHALLSSAETLDDLAALESTGTSTLAPLAFKMYCWEYRAACEPEWNPPVSQDTFCSLPLEGPDSVESVMEADPGQLKAVYRDNFVNAFQLYLDQMNAEEYDQDVPARHRTGEIIFAGHGDPHGPHGFTTVPEYTHVYMYTTEGFSLRFQRGVEVVEGDRGYRTAYGPGEPIPNYTMHPLNSDEVAGLEAARTGNVAYLEEATSLCPANRECSHQNCGGLFADQAKGYRYVHLLLRLGSKIDPAREEPGLEESVRSFLSLAHPERKAFWASSTPRLRHKYHGYSTNEPFPTSC